MPGLEFSRAVTEQPIRLAVQEVSEIILLPGAFSVFLIESQIFFRERGETKRLLVQATTSARNVSGSNDSTDESTVDNRFSLRYVYSNRFVV